MRRLLPVVALGSLLLGLPASSPGEPPPGADGGAEAGSVAGASDEAGEKTPAQRAREFRTQLLVGVELSADQVRRIDEIESQYVKEETGRLAEMAALRDEMKRARREGDGDRV
ncbi:MAG TPA: hypothetical protein VLA09_02080, partial [Longimicrobiales bacterium]|nr:hypothetical protein [Longimicrobiales bacterium]